MQEFPEEYYVPVYGDGSYTTPEKWWAAIGGVGVWMPDWNRNGEKNPQREEKNEAASSIGQTGSSYTDGVGGLDSRLVQTCEKRVCHR